MECHYCHKKGHLNCYVLKKEKKDNAKYTGDGHGRQSSGPPSLVLNATCEETDILVLDDVTPHILGLSPSDTWLLDSNASFHVTPHREWFRCYEAKSLDKVGLGVYISVM